ncbi:MAG: CCA tRNA nucleotidyltransferase [Acutalibacteraceae bacterium]
MALKTIEKLEKSGFEAYLVGGCVRDMFMNRVCHDIDIATNASPKQVLSVFSSWKTVETGIRHGTVTVMLDGESAEITTYRKENGYADNRHPDKVDFLKFIDGDLSRRDFTINAIAYNPHLGMIDLFGGMADISKQKIKCIGKASDRFKEDSLRILRAVRFSSVLGFEIEQETAKAIHEYKHLLKNISAERVAVELEKALCGKNIKNVLLRYFDVFETVIPELSGMKGFEQKNFHHRYDVLEHTAVVVENTEPTVVLRLAALFHDCAKPQCFFLDENGVGHFYSHASLGAKKTQEALKRLKLDNFTTEQTVKLVRIHDTPIEESERVIKRKLNKYGERTLRDLIKLQRADTMGLADEFKSRLAHFERLEELIDEVIKDNRCFNIKGLDINGYEIMNLGYKGKEIGDVLSFLLEAVIDKKTENKKEKLIDYIKQNFPS